MYEGTETEPPSPPSAIAIYGSYVAMCIVTIVTHHSQKNSVDRV